MFLAVLLRQIIRVALDGLRRRLSRRCDRRRRGDRGAGRKARRIGRPGRAGVAVVVTPDGQASAQDYCEKGCPHVTPFVVDLAVNAITVPPDPGALDIEADRAYRAVFAPSRHASDILPVPAGFAAIRNVYRLGCYRTPAFRQGW
jgi:hypothetical protein